MWLLTLVFIKDLIYFNLYICSLFAQEDPLDVCLVSYSAISITQAISFKSGRSVSFSSKADANIAKLDELSECFNHLESPNSDSAKRLVRNNEKEYIKYLYIQSKSIEDTLLSLLFELDEASSLGGFLF